MDLYLSYWFSWPMVILFLLVHQINRALGQSCLTTADCIDSGTTCQDVDIPTKSGSTYGTRIEKRCICTEALRQPCYEDADCTQKYSGVTGLFCQQSLTCPGQTGLGYCRLVSSNINLVDLRGLSPTLSIV
ncbi:uncharacterized protein LOC129585876 [Paramacrobiotus metropolitanus]|uniref:uncharacterized protein LOC129585876 n=1 Tax=Paramacrobiotus metropolitanus TaxID=2943436 RepID=UPI002446066E|nr:uncharacterized protein LOC129585876 [Paramacrobiotus metropolitanus]